MDTRSKKFKYSLFAKGLCLILSAIFVFTAVNSAYMFFQSASLFGIEKYMSGNYGSYFESEDFNNHIFHDTNSLIQLSSAKTTTLEEQLSSQASEKVTEALNAYLDQKAYIIQSELEYAVDNYDESYFNYEYSADLVTIPESTTVTSVYWEEESSFEGDDSADTESIPRNIEAAQKVLATASGREFLEYEAFVRDSAFDVDWSYGCEVVFYDLDSNYSSTTFKFSVGNMLYSESQIKQELYSQYNNMQTNYISQYSSYFEGYEYYLSKLSNLHYYVTSSENTVHTNLKSKPEIADIKQNDIYIVFDGKNAEIHGIKNEDYTDSLKTSIASCTGKEIYIYIDETELAAPKTSDVYSDMYAAHSDYSFTYASNIIALSVFSVILAVLFLIILLCLCGHSNSSDSPALAFIDKVPTDIHFVFSFGLIIGGLVLTVLLMENTIFDYYNSYKYFDYVGYLISALTVAMWLLFTEWLASTVRIKKCSLSFFKRTVIAKFIKWIYTGTKKLNAKIRKAISYRPQKMTKLTIAFIIGYVLINFLLSFFAIISYYIFYSSLPILLFFALQITFNILVAIFFMKYIKMFDDIITATCEHRNVDFGSEKVPEELKLLSDNLANSNQQLDEAIAKAIKDEQMKTELITNVSHDLKTPLTSLITYSDLLGKCDITDENAVKYTHVIHQQSIKLKRLIEDLIEASKVSTGNVTLNKAVLNLSELAVQAIAEFAPETEKNGNEIKFSEPEDTPKVYADGSKTYRIISNLLSNAKKYSAPDTRIYVSVYSDGINGYFEIKNISSEPLNISPDELTERFVRGDKSRSREGNGLGLSIAKDLCSIQDGELKLIIDGDLFKAIVKLPCKKDEDEITVPVIEEE